MDDLIAFLCARLDEREARHAADWWQECKVCREPDPCWHVRNVEAERRIVERYEQAARDATILTTSEDRWDARIERASLADVLKLLALPDASHRDYDERWRP